MVVKVTTPRLTLEDETKADLREMAEAGDVYAGVILKLGEGSQSGAARALGVSRPTVIAAERLFRGGGIGALRGRRRRGGTRVATDDLVRRVVRLRERGLSIRQIMHRVHGGGGRPASRATVARICEQ